MKTVAVIFGGDSCESDVSVLTGVTAVRAMKKEWKVIPLYFTPDGAFLTGDVLLDLDAYKAGEFKGAKTVLFKTGGELFAVKKNRLKKMGKVDVVLNACHGGSGENGALSGYFETLKIPFSSPSVAPSAVAMDKSLSKAVLKGLSVPTVAGKTFRGAFSVESAVRKIKDELGFPVIVKPARLGSSVGIRVAKDERSLSDALAYARRFDDAVLAETFLQNATEVNCAVYRENGKAVCSPLERPVKSGDILSFDDKYLSGKREFPASLNEETANAVQTISKKIYDELCFTGVIRIDFLVADKTVYVNEINAVPGSLSYYLFIKDVSDYGEFLGKLVLEGEREFARKRLLSRKSSGFLWWGSGAKGAKGALAAKKE